MITVYSTPTCSKCKILKNMLKKDNIEFNEISDFATLESKGFMSVPMVEVDDTIKNFDETLQWIQQTKTQKAGNE